MKMTVGKRGRKPAVKEPETTVDVEIEENGTSNYDYVPDEKHLLEVWTMAGNTFKNLLDALKPILSEANIEFSEKGLKLAAVDTKQRALVHLSIPASSFRYFHCKARLVLGVDIEQLHTTIKTNKHNDLMSFVVREDRRNELQISFKNMKNETTTDKLKLKKLKEYNIVADDLTYNATTKMDSAVFQKICREMATIHATKLEIRTSRDNKLIFHNIDGSTDRTVCIEFTPPEEQDRSNKEPIPVNEENDEDDDNESTGIYLLNFLKSFAKASSLSPEVSLYLRTGGPLICVYSVAGLGTVKFCLASEPEAGVDSDVE